VPLCELCESKAVPGLGSENQTVFVKLAWSNQAGLFSKRLDLHIESPFPGLSREVQKQG
jgi:hypothetical protein